MAYENKVEIIWEQSQNNTGIKSIFIDVLLYLKIHLVDTAETE